MKLHEHLGKSCQANALRWNFDVWNCAEEDDGVNSAMMQKLGNDYGQPPPAKELPGVFQYIHHSEKLH